MTSSRYLIAGAAAALLQMGVAAAQSPPPEQGAQPTQPTHPAEADGKQRGATFESLDTDGDGRISKTEAAADPKVMQQFSMYDKNGNGYIEKSEVMSANDSPPEAPKQ